MKIDNELKLDYIRFKLHYEYKKNGRDLAKTEEMKNLFHTLDELQRTPKEYLLKIKEIKEKLDVQNFTCLDLLYYFCGLSGENFFLFEMNKYHHFKDEEKAILIAKSPYVPLRIKIEDLKEIACTTSNIELKKDIEDWIDFKNYCLDKIYKFNDDNIFFINSTNGLSISRSLKELEQLTCCTDRIIIRKMDLENEDYFDHMSNIGSVSFTRAGGQIYDVFLKDEYLSENIKSKSLSKYFVVLNVDVDKYDIIRTLNHCPDNVVLRKLEINDDLYQRIKEEDKHSCAWMYFNVEVALYTSHDHFEKPQVFRNYAFEYSKIVSKEEFDVYQMDIVDTYKKTHPNKHN